MFFPLDTLRAPPDTRHARDSARDHLLAHPDRAVEYGRIKQQLASSVHDIDQYTRGKTDLIPHGVDVKRSARGLPLEPVWEE